MRRLGRGSAFLGWIIVSGYWCPLRRIRTLLSRGVCVCVCFWRELLGNKSHARGKARHKTFKEGLTTLEIRVHVADRLTEADSFSGKLINGGVSLKTCSTNAPWCYWMSSFSCVRFRLTNARRVTSGLVPLNPRLPAKVVGHWPRIRADAVINAPGWSGSPAAARTGRTATAPWDWPAPL